MSFKNINIIGREYEVFFLDDLKELVGNCDSDNLKINIKNGQPALLETDTVLHEVVHAIDVAMQLNMSERQVYCVTTGLIATLKDNQQFLEYLYKALKK
jgi:hypothetical protein